MGSIKRLHITPGEICRRYVAGESAGFLSLRARVPVYRITEILIDAGVRIRGPHEALRLALPARAAHMRQLARRRQAA